MHTILTEWKTLAKLGLPILIAQIAQMLNGVTDTMMAGHASARDLAAVGIGTGIWGPVLLFFIGTLSALQPTISNHNGAQEHHKIMPVLWQGLYIAVISCLCMALILMNASPIFYALKLDAATATIAQAYLDALVFGAPAVLFLNTLRGLTDGLGHTRIIMVFSLVSTVLNVPFNYWFIYGVDWGFIHISPMGGEGCGWATTASNWIALASLLVYLQINKEYKAFHLIDHWHRFDKSLSAQLLKVGLPIGLAFFVEISMFCAIALFLSPLGPNVIAGHQLVLNATSLFFMIPLSLGMALTLRISFLIGANEHAKAKLLARSALVLAGGIALINAPLLYLGREWITSLYTTEPAVIQVAVGLFALAAIFQIADVTQVSMISVLRGFKDTKVPMMIQLFSFWGLCLPLGFLLTFGYGVVEPKGAAGFWLALIIGLAAAASLLGRRMWVKTHQ